MSADALGRIIARKSVAIGGARAQAGDGGGGAAALLKTIGAYIPTEVTTGYVALAGGIATIPEPGMPWTLKLQVAIGGAIVAAFVTWVRGHDSARKRAKENNQPVPNAATTFRAGWYEILASVIALFVWATAMPDSWYTWGTYAPFLPTVVVALASGLIAGVASLLNRDIGGS